MVIRLMIYFVGVYSPPRPTSSRYNAIQAYKCTELGCESTFLSRSVMSKHVKRFHRNDRVYCRHACGKTYVKQCNSLKHHERTCNMSPDTIRVGSGVNQQHYYSSNNH